jgi:orotidine-5'-phosphate decarboxylase
MRQPAANPVFCAIDTPSLEAADHLAHRVTGEVGGLKLGLEFFCAQGPEGVRRIAGHGRPIFLDLKLHDIPNTVASAIRSVVPLEPAFITVHAAGGRAMLAAAAAAAKEAADRLHVARPKLRAVTVLTSLDGDDLHQLGMPDDVEHLVDRLAFLAEDSGIDGLVCSAREIAHLRRRFGREIVLMVPGIRPSWSGADDQKRVTGPAEALAAGADYLVIGRPITMATDPADAARRIAAEIAGTV